MQVTRSNYRAWKSQTGSFAAMEAVSGRTLPVEFGAPRSVSTAFASAGLFPMLGVQAHIGRLFTASEDRRGADAAGCFCTNWRA